jgi:hypothetical protein
LSKKKQDKIGKNKKLKRKTIGEVKNREDLINHIKHLEKRIQILETEKHLLDAERLRLKQELQKIRREVKRSSGIKLTGDQIFEFLINNIIDEEQKESADRAIKKIRSIMKKESVNELTIKRQYLLEIFSEDLLELSKDDGLPNLKPSVLGYFGLKGIITKLYGNVLKLKKELLDKELASEAFKLAINSRISAYQVEKAFKILENLPHEEAQNILKRITEKIGAAAEFLVDSKKYELAREQLYIAINKYQREALSDDLKYLTEKLTDILIQIFKIQVKTNEIYAAKYTYDEIENMWDPTSYKVEKTDLDSTLKVLINSFLEKNNFGIAAILINKLNSLTLKQDLSKISAELEDKYKDSLKKEIQEDKKKGEEILAEFVKAESDIITDMNRKKIKENNKASKKK